jgi:hypothetical protein
VIRYERNITVDNAVVEDLGVNFETLARLDRETGRMYALLQYAFLAAKAKNMRKV